MLENHLAVVPFLLKVCNTFCYNFFFFFGGHYFLKKLIALNNYSISITEPNAKPAGPVFKTFPKSATLSEGEAAKFECETEKAPKKGE